MSKWQYKGEWYESVPFDWNNYTEFNNISDFFKYLTQNYVTVPIKYKWKEYPEPLLYHKKWDKCYVMTRFGYSGNGNQLKFQLEDIYQPEKCHYAMAKEVELVKKIDYVGSTI